MKPIQLVQKFGKEEDLIEALVDIANLMVTKEKRLRPIEKKCLRVMVQAHNKFGGISDKEPRDWIIAQLSKGSKKFTLNSLSRYRSQLIDKGWLKTVDKEHQIFPVFNRRKVSYATDRIFVFRLSSKE